MESVQTMRWILVNLTAVAAVIAGVLGHVVPAAILLTGVAAHTLHWWTHRQVAVAAPRDPGLRD
jgi:hypothetical protein